MLLVTPVFVLLWQVKMSNVKLNVNVKYNNTRIGHEALCVLLLHDETASVGHTSTAHDQSPEA